MKLLIDTQILFWLVNQDKRLGDNAIDLLEERSNELYISYFSIFELTIKAAIGKLDFNPEIIDDLAEMDITISFPEAKTLENYKIFNPNNKDPFDNALISVALKENCVFVTADKNIINTHVNGLSLLNARK